MQVRHLHDWDVTPTEAIAIQKDFADRLITESLDIEVIHHVAGVDVSVKNGISQAAVVILTFPDLYVVEVQTASMPTPFPYVPGLLTFREGPALEMVFEQVQQTPDALIFDGMGRIHPRRMGIAAHFGLWLDLPTIGCGKTHFIGDYAEPETDKGAFSPLHHKGDQLGVVLRTRTNVKPVHISPGHRSDIDSARDLALRCTPKYRLPEPIRQAHNAAGAM